MGQRYLLDTNTVLDYMGNKLPGNAKELSARVIDEAISDEDFKKWVEYAEDFPTVSLTDAKQRWVAQKKKLQKLIR